MNSINQRVGYSPHQSRLVIYMIFHAIAKDQQLKNMPICNKLFLWFAKTFDTTKEKIFRVDNRFSGRRTEF